jgi:hypothetical protein
MDEGGGRSSGGGGAGARGVRGGGERARGACQWRAFQGEVLAVGATGAGAPGEKYLNVFLF